MKRLSIGILFLLIMLSFTQMSYGSQFCDDCCDSDHCTECLFGNCCLVSLIALPTSVPVLDMGILGDEIIPAFSPALCTSECIYPPDQPPRLS